MKTVAREEFVRNAGVWLELARHGETVAVVEDGHPSVMLGPDREESDDEAEAMIRRLSERRTRMKPVTQDEIRAWIDEGRH